MGFYIRKSFKVGPARINLSKRGVGASIGVKGHALVLMPRAKATCMEGEVDFTIAKNSVQARPAQTLQRCHVSRAADSLADCSERFLS